MHGRRERIALHGAAQLVDGILIAREPAERARAEQPRLGG